MSNPGLIMPRLPLMMDLQYTLDISGLGFTQFSIFVVILLVVGYIMTGRHLRSETLDVKFSFVISILFTIFSFGLVNLSFIPKITLLQFYTRFMVIAFPLGLFLIGKLLSRENRQLIQFFTLITLVFTLISYFSVTAQQSKSFVSKSFSTFQDSMVPQDYFEAMTSPQFLLSSSFYEKSINKPGVGEVDYVPNGSPYKVTELSAQGNQGYLNFQNYFINDVYKQTYFVGSDLQHRVTSRGLEISWRSEKNQKTMLPVLSYAHTKVILNGKVLSSSETDISYIGALKVNAQAGKNVLIISYHPSKWFVCGAFIQIVSVFGSCIFIFVKRRNLD
ncbi:hypothetical protein OfM1_12150 [Lactovum odontotermitis]